MPTISARSTPCTAYTVPSAITSRSTAVLTMVDVTSVVFVVDDDISIRESLELLVKRQGWGCETFASAQEFLSQPRATVPCCLVLDVTLPGLNGLELQQQLADRGDMPIIFITGHGDIPMTVQAMKAGAVEFFSGVVRPSVRLQRCTCFGTPTRRSHRENVRSWPWSSRGCSTSKWAANSASVRSRSKRIGVTSCTR